VDILHCYGELSDVINSILEEAAAGSFDCMNKPPCPGREGAGRYDIDVTEPMYLELLSTYGPFSSKISLRRLIYWFVENEMYNELGWEPLEKFVNRRSELFKKKISNAISELQKALRYCDNTYKDKLNELIEVLKNEREHIA
jgi:hypothetical protein